jgi:hypothetical protein
MVIKKVILIPESMMPKEYQFEWHTIDVKDLPYLPNEGDWMSLQVGGHIHDYVVKSRIFNLVEQVVKLKLDNSYRRTQY